MENQRESQTGGSRRPARRRSSRPAGAPKAENRGASASSAAQKQQSTSTPKSQNSSNSGSNGKSSSQRSHRPRRKKNAVRGPQRNIKTKQIPPRKKGHATADGTVVFERDGTAGKAPKRYTRSSNGEGPRPITRHLTRKQAKRTSGRAYPETSAGGILLRHTKRAYNTKNDRVYLSTVKVPIIGRTDRRGRILWSLPKGHIEDYETVPMTAEREVLEETGIHGRAIKKLGTVDYWFLSDEKRIHKTVHHYLLKYESGKLSDADPEVSQVAWVSLPDLPRRLSHADERKLARRATGVVSTWIREEYAQPHRHKAGQNQDENAAPPGGQNESAPDREKGAPDREKRAPDRESALAQLSRQGKQAQQGKQPQQAKRRRRRRGSRGRGRGRNNPAPTTTTAAKGGD